jgi:uncharacterized membrane protein (DUF106 family)
MLAMAGGGVVWMLNISNSYSADMATIEAQQKSIQEVQKREVEIAKERDRNMQKRAERIEAGQQDIRQLLQQILAK